MWHRAGFTLIAMLLLLCIALFVKGLIALYGATRL
jgi:competence protein ComGC